jgi:hypothetical protein
MELNLRTYQKNLQLIYSRNIQTDIEKMNDFDSELREQSIISQIDMISNQSNVLIASKNHELFTKKLTEKECIIDIAKTKSDSNNELVFEFENIGNKKFQVILLDETIDNVSNPIEFIKKIKEFLMPEGYLLCTAYNLFNSINRLRFLNGDSQIINSVLRNRNLEFSSLDSILLTLSESNLSIGKIVRVEKEINIKSRLELNTFSFTEELIKILTSDSESNTFYYVFSIINKVTVDPNIRRWTSKFSKNLVTDAFKEVLVNYKLQFEKHINYLKQTNREQYTSMISINQFNNTTSEKDVSDKNNSLKKENKQDNKKFKDELMSDLLEDGSKFLERSLQEKDEFLQSTINEERENLENAIKEKDGYLDNAIKEKDEYLENVIKEKDEYLENALKDKDEVIKAIQNSFAFRMLSKLDKLLGRKYKNK